MVSFKRCGVHITVDNNHLEFVNKHKASSKARAKPEAKINLNFRSANRHTGDGDMVVIEVGTHTQARTKGTAKKSP